MKKTWKKIISVLLVIAMVTGGISLPERNVYASTDGDTTGGVGGGSSTKKSEANTCTYGYRIYIAPNTITDEKRDDTVSQAYTQLQAYAKYAVYSLRTSSRLRKNEDGSINKNNGNLYSITTSNTGSSVLRSVPDALIEAGDMAGFSMLTGDPSTTFHYWYNETEKNNSYMTEFIDWANNTYAGENAQTNIETFLNNYKTALTNAGISTSWIPSTVSDFLSRWYIIVEPVCVYVLKDKNNCFVYSAQDFYRNPTMFLGGMNKYNRIYSTEQIIAETTYFSQISYLMYVGCYTKQQTKSGNWVCTYDSKDHADLVYTEAQKANDEAECRKSYEDSSFFYANSGFGIYGGNFVMEVGQPFNIGMTVTYDINGSRIGSSVTTEGNITQEEREA